MATHSAYRSKLPDQDGKIPYDAAEDAVWRNLLARQEKLLPGRVCDAFLAGLDALDLPRERIPQLAEINARLARTSGFGVAAVPALISPEKFFGLLAARRFPVATFIRRREEFDYLQEPDIFHEVFGHCPLLTNPDYADFLQRFGETALAAGKPYFWRLQRLFWFTVEFGLVAAKEGTRIFGAGIASSPGETHFALESGEPEHLPFDPVEIFRTPYRIDIYQPVYYVIEDFRQLRDLFDRDLVALMDQAKALGQLPPRFPPAETDTAA